ncbi:MAG: hypothetical protein HYV60_19060 [Planctomycetia bacterium]|nr:hypothetical protein [Planctomycetia bacterium]
MSRFSDAPVVVPVDMSVESLAAVDVALEITDSPSRGRSITRSGVTRRLKSSRLHSLTKSMPN